MKEAANAPKPKMLKNPSGMPGVKKTASGGNLSGNNLPIVKRVDYLIDQAVPTSTVTDYAEIRIRHDIGRACDVFGRFRFKGTDTWEQFPQLRVIDLINAYFLSLEILSIDETYITLKAANFTPPVELELFFVDFSI